MIKKIVSAAAALLLCTFFCAAHAIEEPQIISESGILINADTGQVLFEKDADTRRPPASITKLMTALLVLENTEMDEVITCSRDAVLSVDHGSTHIWLQEGEQLTVEQAMYAMLIESANDAANVLAVHVDGSLNGFAAKMTARAKELGCTNTNFVNANGLDRDGHYSSTRDMALIARALMKYPKFFEIAGTLMYKLPATNKNDARTFTTKQDMLRKNSAQYDSDVIAGKSGWTTNARHTLVTFGRRNGVNLLVVVMASTKKNEKFADTRALLNYGFEAFHAETLTSDNLLTAAASYCPQDGGNMELDPACLSDTPVLLRQDETIDMVRLSRSPAASPALTASLVKTGAPDKPFFTLPLTFTQKPVDSSAAAAHTSGTTPSGGFPWSAALTVCAMVALHVGFKLRARYLRQKRRQERALLLKSRAKIEDPNAYDWDIDI